MPTTINASNTTGGAVVTGDGSGILELQSGGVTGITVNGPNVTVAGTITSTGGLASPVTVAGNSTAGAEIRLPEDTDNGSNYVAIKAPDSLSGNLTFTLPSADGSAGQLIQTNGSGVLSFTNPTSLASPLAVVGNSAAGAEIRLPEDTDNGSNYVAIKAADSLASNLTFTLPSADGTNGQYLQTNGSGGLSFSTVSMPGATNVGGIVGLLAYSVNTNSGTSGYTWTTHASPSGAQTLTYRGILDFLKYNDQDYNFAYHAPFYSTYHGAWIIAAKLRPSTSVYIPGFFISKNGVDWSGCFDAASSSSASEFNPLGAAVDSYTGDIMIFGTNNITSQNVFIKFDQYGAYLSTGAIAGTATRAFKQFTFLPGTSAANGRFVAGAYDTGSYTLVVYKCLSGSTTWTASSGPTSSNLSALTSQVSYNSTTFAYPMGNSLLFYNTVTDSVTSVTNDAALVAGLCAFNDSFVVRVSPNSSTIRYAPSLTASVTWTSVTGPSMGASGWSVEPRGILWDGSNWILLTSHGWFYKNSVNPTTGSWIRVLGKESYIEMPAGLGIRPF